MTSKIFINKANAICKKHNCEKQKDILDNQYVINSFLGKVYLRFDPSPRIKLYSVFMRFLEPEKFNPQAFQEAFSIYEQINKSSLKWNLHNINPEYVLDIIDERIDNLIYNT